MAEYRTRAIERRAFLLGASGVGLLAAASGAQAGAHGQHGIATDAQAAPPATARVRGYVFFNPMEAIDLEALVDTFIPADEVGPGALELGVPVYIDRQLAGAFGQGARRYMQGPFAEGTQQQGWQIAMTPAQLFRAGLADINALLAERQIAFAELSPADRATLLGDIDGGKIRLATVPTRLFFDLALSLVHEGYFGDPIHGGNRGLGSWKMIGFPGVAGMYADKVAPYRNRPYPIAPRSIEDLL